MPQVRANGITIEYESIGREGGSAILLVMGFATALTGWPDSLCNGLAAKGFRVIRFDNRDIGKSTHLTQLGAPDLAVMMAKLQGGQTPVAPYSLDDMAADAAGLLTALGIDRAHIVGASMGGMIGQLRPLLLAHPPSHQLDGGRRLPAPGALQNSPAQSGGRQPLHLRQGHGQARRGRAPPRRSRAACERRERDCARLWSDAVKGFDMAIGANANGGNAFAAGVGARPRPLARPRSVTRRPRAASNSTAFGAGALTAAMPVRRRSAPARPNPPRTNWRSARRDRRFTLPASRRRQLWRRRAARPTSPAQARRFGRCRASGTLGPHPWETQSSDPAECSGGHQRRRNRRSMRFGPAGRTRQ